MRAELESLEARIGHRFTDREILRRALTHSSHAQESRAAAVADVRRDNEQLEFLGDAVLGFLISDHLLLQFPDYSEGKLSALKAHLVSAVHLHEVAQTLDVGAHLHLGRGEERTGGRTKRTVLADALEALIAALYLDGGVEAARAFVEREIFNAGPLVTDYKTALQELALARKLPLPRYAVVREEGPGHSKIFTVEVRMGAELTGRGEASSKKAAAHNAARDVYERLVQ